MRAAGGDSPPLLDSSRWASAISAKSSTSSSTTTTLNATTKASATSSGFRRPARPVYVVRAAGTNGLEDCSTSTTERQRDLALNDWNNKPVEIRPGERLRTERPSTPSKTCEL